MPVRHGSVALTALMLGLWLQQPCAVFALDPHKALTQYTRTVWTQEEGLPQETIRAMAQTTDGYSGWGQTKVWCVSMATTSLHSQRMTDRCPITP